MAQAAVNALKLYGVAMHEATSHRELADNTELVQFRSIAAVVAKSAYVRAVLGDKEMAEYTSVLEEVHSITAVLPAPPGTVFRSKESLNRWLELHYFSLTNTLGSVEGHGQARLIITKTPGTDPGNATSSESKESAKQLIATASQSMRILRGHAAATVTLPPMEDDNEVVAQASFLVEIDGWTQFAELVAKEDERQTALDFALTGPWPPYDFVKMQFGG
ncbi:MAG: GvpL/GvpF family gas vesicle protein [Gemmatimonadaceae bacterium]